METNIPLLFVVGVKRGAARQSEPLTLQLVRKCRQLPAPLPCQAREHRRPVLRWRAVGGAGRVEARTGDRVAHDAKRLGDVVGRDLGRGKSVGRGLEIHRPWRQKY